MIYKSLVAGPIVSLNLTSYAFNGVLASTNSLANFWQCSGSHAESLQLLLLTTIANVSKEMWWIYAEVLIRLLWLINLKKMIKIGAR